MMHDLQPSVGERRLWPASWLRWLLVGIGLAAIYVLREKVATALTPFFYALLLAYFLTPLIKLLENRGLSRPLAIGLVYLLLLVGVTLLGIYVIPTIVAQVNSLIRQLPAISVRAQEMLLELADQYERIDLHPAIMESIENSLLRLQGGLTTLFNLIGQFFVGLFSSVLAIILVPILTFYMLKDMETIQASLFALVPTPLQPGVLDVVSRINTKLGAWVRGQVLVSISTGGLMFLGMRLLGMDYALALGLLVAVFNFIPYFGAIIGATPAVLLGLLRSFSLGLKVLILQVVVQQIESFVLVPQILGKELSVHPLLLMFALLIGAQFGGVLGMILAGPVAAILVDIAKGWWSKPQEGGEPS